MNPAVFSPASHSVDDQNEEDDTLAVHSTEPVATSMMPV